MAESPDYSFVGSGIILIREHGSAAPMLEVGNVSAFSLSPQTNSLQLPDYRNPGGGIRNRIDRVTDWALAYTFHDFNSANLARVTRGLASAIEAGTVTAEEVVGYKGGYVPLKFIAATITSVNPIGTGSAYTAGTDYILDRGMLYIPADTTIPDPVAGAANFKVTYTRLAGAKVEGAVTAGKNFQMEFRGQNEARNGKYCRLVAHKVSGGVISEMALLGDNYGAGEVNGSVLYDSTKAVDANTSGYFYWQQED